MPVFQMELQWIDIDQSESLTLLFFTAADLAAGLSKAASIAANVQPYSELRLIDVRISLDVNAVLSGVVPSGSSRSRLTLWCEAIPDAVSGKRYRFKSVLYGAVAALGNPPGLAFDPTTPESQAFLSTVLALTTDLRGNAFDFVIGGVFTQIGN